MSDPSSLFGSGTFERRRETSSPIGFHVTMRLEDDRPIAASVAELRVIARVMIGPGERRGLLAFGAADDHLHAELVSDRTSAGAFALYVESALRQTLRLGARFREASIRPLQDQKHAYHTFRYVHRQDSRHELHRDWAREGTSLPDLLGLRVLKTSLGARVRAHLPRIHRADLTGQFPAGAFDEDRPFDLRVLAEAAAAAFAVPDLAGRSMDVVRARRAAVHVAGPRVPSSTLGDCLGISVRSVRVFRTVPREPHVVRAVRLQALLRTPASPDEGAELVGGDPAAPADDRPATSPLSGTSRPP